LLPEMYKRGMPARLARTTGERIRLHSRAQYLAAFRRLMNRHDDHTGVSAEAKIAASASISGPCLIGAGAVIEDGAVIHESIVLGGARIGSDAVISHSVIGPRAVVETGAVVRNSVHAAVDVARDPGPGRDRGRTDTGAASRSSGQHRPGVRGMFRKRSATGAAAPHRSTSEGDQ
jgi:NDP-sugar pyrophosphorylase family protein